MDVKVVNGNFVDLGGYKLVPTEDKHWKHLFGNWQPGYVRWHRINYSTPGRKLPLPPDVIVWTEHLGPDLPPQLEGIDRRCGCQK
jgi:hypothetical protein